MKNYFVELKEKGVNEIVISLRELQNLYIEGRITDTQFTKILMQQYGEEKFMEVFNCFVNSICIKNLLEKGKD